MATQSVDKKPVLSISLCICTMNRATALDQCLNSVFQAKEAPDEIIVSDDSPDGTPTQMVVAKYPGVIYQEGPHCGLGSNRNACIRSARSSHIIFIDDDVQVPLEFFQIACELIKAFPPKTVITGYEFNHANAQMRKVTPHNIDFWGLQRVPVKDQYRAIVINAAIFPRTLFDQALFDEQLRYGSEEIDMSCHAVAIGYQITYSDRLYVHHYPSPINRESYQQFVHASRLYATTKAYWQYERAWLKTAAYLLLAPLQLAGSSVRRGNIKDLWEAFQAINLAYSYLMRSLVP